MPLNSSIVGTIGDSLTSDVDARWTMAYAAALGDTVPRYFNTLDPNGIVAHPLFPVCFEWPVIVAMRKMFDRTGLTPAEASRGVHASHDLTIHRPIRPPERLRTWATVVGIEQRKPGAYQLTRLDTVDEHERPLCTSWYGSIYRDVRVEGPNNILETPPVAPMPPSGHSQAVTESTISVAAGLAHTYTECARIFNPIHTDAAVAHAAGLPSIILHGTATLARAVSKVIAIEAKNDPACVIRIAGRFAAMVTMPSQIILRVCGREHVGDRHRIFFEVINDRGATAIRDGLVVLGNGASE